MIMKMYSWTIDLDKMLVWDALGLCYTIVWSGEYIHLYGQEELAFRSSLGFLVHLDSNRVIGGRPRFLEELTEAHNNYMCDKYFTSPS